MASSPLVQDETIYIMSFSDGTLHALSFEGEELWNISTGEVHPMDKIQVLNMTEKIAGGQGTRMGTAYRLESGLVVYVPENSTV